MPTGESLLPPTETLGPEEFEDFTERLLNAQKFSTHPEARCIEVGRWGRRGEPQDGIDFAGLLSDDRRAAWQCKRYATFAPADVRAAVTATTYQADVYYLVLSCEASSSVRLEMENHPCWRLLDKRGLGNLLDDLPLHKCRDVLDETWGVARRKRLMRTPGEDRFITLSALAESRNDAASVLNDRGSFTGREQEVEKITAVTDRSKEWPRVVLVAGPGGRGKTRLLIEALSTFEERHPQIPLLMSSDGALGQPSMVEELPQVPATIVIDDAHRNPERLRELVSYAGRVFGTQLVIACRPSALASVRAEVARDLAPDQVVTVEVGELSPRDAQRLVADVSGERTLPFALRWYLAEQAAHSPHVAVIAVNLIERGQLSGALATDAALRERVLDRYRDVTAGSIEGYASATVNRVLAVHAALGLVDDEDADLRQRMAEVVGLTERELLLIRAALLDGGVLTRRDGITQVVPEILADTAMEREAVVGGLATSFAREMWDAFGPSSDYQLMVVLADLDWRLTQQHRPSIIEPVWDDFSAHLLAKSLDDLYVAIGRLDELARTLPGRFIALLEDLRPRLRRQHDVASGRAGSECGDKSQHSLFPVQPHDVLGLLPPLYAGCAIAEQSLLEVTLDAIWDLRRSDRHTRGPAGNNPAHTAAERLADLRHVRDHSVPGRIVDRVALWLESPPLSDDVVTPLVILRNLTSKSGVDTEQTSSRTLQLSPYRFSPELVRPLRDRLRTVLQEQVGGRELQRAADAVDLLGRMVQQPDAPPGASLTTADVLAWEDDDLATLAALDAASRTTPSAVVRRSISRLVAPHAEHAPSIAVRHAALVLQSHLDSRGEDELADVLLPGLRTGTPSRPSGKVPGLDEFRAEVEAERVRRAALTEAARSTEDETRRTTRVEARMEWHAGQGTCRSSALRLLSVEDPSLVVAEVDRVARDVATFRPHQPPRLHGLYQAFSAATPAVVAVLVQEVADLVPGPLDADLAVLLEAWREQGAAQLVDWLGDLRRHRPAVCSAAARAFEVYGWHHKGQGCLSLFDVGVDDPRAEVRDAFWAASGALLSAHPGAVARRLLAAAASPVACNLALLGASRPDGRVWGERLTAHDAASVLHIADRVGGDGWTTEQIVTGIAVNHPGVVLQHLLETDAALAPLHGEVEGLAEVLDGHGEVLARWLVTRARAHSSSTNGAVNAVVLADGLGATTAAALEPLVHDLDPDALAHFLSALEPLGGQTALSTWPQQRSRLTRAVLQRARALGTATTRTTTAQLESAMSVRSWGSVNGVSEELERALTVTTARVADEPDGELRAMYARAGERLLAQSSDEHQRYDVD